jgi:NTE family protein
VSLGVASHPYRFGLALGGGTARAFAHVGVLDVLAEAGLAPDIVSGTSFGALIAAHYALFADTEKLLHWTHDFPTLEVWEQGLDFGLHRAALVEGGRVERWLERTLFHGATFADLKLPLRVTCMDVDTGELVVLERGSLAGAVRASCALPVLTRPVVVEGRTLIDGGFVSPVPLAPLLEDTEVVLGVHTGIAIEQARTVQLYRNLHASSFGSWWHRRFLHAPQHSWGTLLRALARAGTSYATALSFAPEALLLRTAPPIAWWDFHRRARAVEAGQGAMRRALPALRAKLGTSKSGTSTF